jgi:hypothetical protein
MLITQVKPPSDTGISKESKILKSIITTKEPQARSDQKNDHETFILIFIFM